MNQNRSINPAAAQSVKSISLSFNQIALGISILLFVLTFSFWFINPDSNASIINLILRKQGLHSGTQSVGISLGWTQFYLHFFIALLSLLIYYKSGFTKYLGSVLSQLYPVQKFFQSDHSTAVKVIIGLRIVLAGIFLFGLYGLIMGLVEGTTLPLGNARICILIFFFLTAVWDIGSIEAEMFPAHVGILSSKTKKLWFRLSENQFAFVQDLTNTNKWILYKDNAYVDLSYTECYLFYPENFNIIITDNVLSKDLVGSIKYSVRSDINTRNLPAFLNTSELVNLNTKFTSHSELDRLIYVLLDDDGLINQAKDNMLSAAQEYYNVDQNIFINNTTKNREDLKRNLFARTDFRPIERMLEKKVKEETDALLGDGNLLKITLNITDAEFKIDDLLKDILGSHRKTAERIKDASIDNQVKIADAAISIAGMPGVSKIRIETLLGTAKKMSETFSITSAGVHRQTEEPARFIEDPLRTASVQLVSAIMEVMEGEPTPEVIAEAVSKSTTFIADNNIPVTAFVQAFFRKLGEEKEERSIEAYQKLAEDTLKDLIAGKS